MFDLFAVFVALGFLIFFAYRGVTLLLLAPGAALLACALTGGLPLLAADTQIFMTSLVAPLVALVLMIVLATLFGSF